MAKYYGLRKKMESGLLATRVRTAQLRKIDTAFTNANFEGLHTVSNSN